jgi:hypothetical protein
MQPDETISECVENVPQFNKLQELAAYEQLKDYFEAAMKATSEEIERCQKDMMESDELMQSARVTFKEPTDRLASYFYDKVMSKFNNFSLVPCTLYRRVDVSVSFRKDIDILKAYRSIKRMTDERFRSLIEQKINQRTLTARICELYDKKTEDPDVLYERIPANFRKLIEIRQLPKIVKTK